MACACGHAEEEHRAGHECRAMVTFNGATYPCSCGMFEADDEDENG